ncbi:hypothetical protein [Thermus phage P23-45]|uniref:Predicted Zn-dependent hydrolase n=1 Tax=Thermus virus P23-45 TaxID=2914006 RepID=A7XXE9_BP234|nr:predicted Zn-dependent hydrolase [Thermus phage P23-45]ABU96945.1 predicted Zn-dependent hydrolase [Thermus phage P23-45]UYB98479.1 hypothetical protein [Thermus phage P23-45]
MSLDLIKLVLLGWALLTRGAPNEWDVALQARVYWSLGAGGGLELAWDPVPIYHRALPQDLCGQFVGWIEVDPDYANKGCRDTLAHELNHAWQFRTYGLVQPITYALSAKVWEPEVPASGAEGMPAPRQLNYPLLKVWVPIW